MQQLLSLLRLRTLPLAASVILCGSALAASRGGGSPAIALLSLACALGLQILSNIANDYGDGIRGTDVWRSTDAPARLTASGAISLTAIRFCMALAALITACLGAALITLSHTAAAPVFWALGACSLAAAVGYTVGRHAYGYHGLGEAAVFLFFGLLGVLGSCYLQTARFYPADCLPAAALGLLCAAVLNVNNLRDIDSDAHAGKRTLAVRLGFARARRLHSALLLTAALLLALYAFFAWQSLLWLPLLPRLLRHRLFILTASSPAAAGRQLRTAVILTFSISLFFSIGLVLKAVMAHAAA